VRFRDFGCEPSFVSLEDDDVVVATSVSSTRADREVSKNVNKSHIEPWLTVPEEVTGEAHFFTVWKNHVIVGETVLWGFTEGDEDSYICFISYWVDRNYVNKGVGTKAVSLCVKHAFDNLNVERFNQKTLPVLDWQRRSASRKSPLSPTSSELVELKHLTTFGRLIGINFS